MSEAIKLNELARRMEGAISTMRSEFASLRTGRASPNLLDNVMVDVYGQQTPIPQLGTVSVPEPRMISVQVWDKNAVPQIEKAIREAGLGLNPMSDGQLVRVPLPELNEERREELAKIARKYAEQARIAVRNVRRDGMEQIKKIEKEIGKDEQKMLSDKVQALTDDHVKRIDEALAAKESEIRQV